MTPTSAASPAPDTPDRFRGCLLGLAVGDALGTTVEFSARGSFAPVTDMIGGGPFGLSPGEWTDDTSMALCLAASLIETGGFDPADQMERYVRWYREGYMSSNGRCFDIGITVRGALESYLRTGAPLAGPTGPRTAGNGCIMRLAPVPMFFHPNEDAAADFSAQSARTTHGAQECIEACHLFGTMLARALGGRDREAILSTASASYQSSAIQAIASGAYSTKQRDQIRGTGYVVASLEAAVWCFATTDSFEDAVLTAVNLADDADTTGAVCGQLAGAFYGESGIPDAWVTKLARRDHIGSLADGLRNARRG